MCNKIINRFNIQRLVALLFLTTFITSNGQQNEKLLIIKKFSDYKQSVKGDSLRKMVELRTIVPNIHYDLRYATINNFVHEQLYKDGDVTFLRLTVARAIAKVERELNEKGLALKIWDAYRPYNVTVRMWNLIKDDRYVADPKKGSGHNRGIAVDLTLIDKASGAALDMGTDFDNFSDTAHQNFTNLPAIILQNRQLLKTTMEKYGFKALETEWWHFYWNHSDFEILDIGPKKFKKN
jgi:D-alanyl-D-alanine dipeptidase